MSVDNLPTVEYLKQCFRYEDGKLYWLVRPLSHFKNSHSCNISNAQRAGHEAGYLSKLRSGDRWVVGVGRKMLYRSRIIWAMHNDRWPSGLIDHKNRITNDDKIGNLRESTDSQNQGNRQIRRDSSSGLKGIWFRSNMNKWAAAIRHKGKRHYLGHFETKESAHAAYCDASKRLFGEFHCNGSSEIVFP